ncbi:MAG TPA: orotidine-5'-phosphate decarboxylase [Terriglobales bacterium]|nr:orotidine-5'-phosphate decarboxylase [Terriglobales bacterium]
MLPLTPRDRLIVALDVSSADQARRIVTAVGESAATFKVGKQLFTAEGPALVRDLVASGRRVFLDLKFHDIPNTVAGAVSEAAKLGVSMLTVHASGGTKMLSAAAEAASLSPIKPLVLGVTVLTSLNDADLQELGITDGVQGHVLRLAGLALQAGCSGIVASAQEAAHLRQTLGTGFAIVTPGVRPAGADAGDQARVVTPKAAIEAGASYIVVGRPITGSADPAGAASAILAELR